MRHRQRPRWWPEDEAWPPTGPIRHRFPARMFFRAGCLAALIFLLIFAMLAVVFWLTAQALGIASIPARAYVSILPLGVLTLVVIVAGIIWLIRALRSSLRPMSDLLDAARRVADGDFSARVAERGPRELREAARVFNAMAARLQVDAEQRRDLLADVTHELRTPLTVIQGNVEGLIDGIYPADEAHLKLILNETARLSRLVDDLRTLALAESGALALRREPTDLAILARETAASFRAQADAAGVSIGVEEGDQAPHVMADPARIHEALANLIANALRYSPEAARITIRVEAAPSADGVQWAALSVADTGSGISAEELPHIFDRFHRSSDSGGMGLGLAITKNLVAAHGGEIGAVSEPGRGTTIRITLPVRK